MNNQIPYVDNFYIGGNPNFNPNYNNQNNIYRTVERLNNRVNRLERQVKILENRVNRLTSNDSQFYNSEFDDNNNMYIL